MKWRFPAILILFGGKGKSISLLDGMNLAGETGPARPNTPATDLDTTGPSSPVDEEEAALEAAEDLLDSEAATSSGAAAPAVALRPSSAVEAEAGEEGEAVPYDDAALRPLLAKLQAPVVLPTFARYFREPPAGRVACGYGMTWYGTVSFGLCVLCDGSS